MAYGPGRSGYDCVSTCISRMACVGSLPRISASARANSALARAGGFGMMSAGAARRGRGLRGFDRRPRSGSAGVAMGGSGSAGAGGGGGTSASNERAHDFGLAVSAGLELGERGVALLHAVVVNAVARALGVDLVRGDGLLFERERLLFEQRVVFIELVGVELLRPLGLHDVLAELAVDLGDLVRGHRGDFGHAIVGGGSCSRRAPLPSPCASSRGWS